MNTSLSIDLGPPRDFGEAEGADSAPAQAPPVGDLHIVSVGVTDYPIEALKLRYPAKDAEDIHTLFKAQVGRLYRRVTEELLTDEQATKRNIVWALEKVAETCQPHDTLLLYMAGHGALHLKTKLYYFLPYDVDPDEMMLSALAGHDFSTVLGRIPGRRLVILDTCNAGSVLPNGTLGSMRSIDIEQAAQASPKLIAEGLLQGTVLNRSTALHSSVPGTRGMAEDEIMAVLAATRKVQPAFEPLARNNGLFTHFLLQGLSGAADTNGSGEITLNGLFEYVNRKVLEEAQGEQEPTLSTIGTTARVVVARGPFSPAGTPAASVPAPILVDRNPDAPAKGGDTGDEVDMPPATQARTEELEGETIGNYVIGRRLASDADTALYLATVEGQGQSTVLFRWLDREQSKDDDARERFYQRARMLKDLDHPGVARYREDGKFKGAYVVLDAPAGQALSGMLAGAASSDSPETAAPGASLLNLPAGLAPLSMSLIGPMREGVDALRVLREVAGALCHAHERGVLHLGVRPDRVLIAEDGSSCLLDSPAMRARGQNALPAVPRTGSAADPGHPIHYLAPECLAQPAKASDKSDVYALGALAYLLLSGRPAFPFDQIAQVAAAKQTGSPPPIAIPHLRAKAQSLLQDMLARDPATRPNMREVLAALKHLPSVTSERVHLGPVDPAGLIQAISPRLRRWLVPAAGALAVSVLTAVLIPRLHRPRPGGDAPPPRPPSSMAPKGPSGPGPSLAHPGPAARATPPASIVAIAPVEQASPPEPGEPGMAYLRGGQTAAARIVPYFLDRTEVTNTAFAEWLNRQTGLQVKGEAVRDGVGRTLLSLNPRYSGLAYEGGNFHPRAGAGRKPVVQVSWEAARQFCFSEKKRLPLDNEWDMAARGAALDRPFPWGNEAPRCDGVVAGRAGKGACVGRTADASDVGSGPQDRTPEGVMDLAGNVAEWVNTRTSNSKNKTLSARGGDWARPATGWSQPLNLKPGALGASLGFRCAKGAPPPSTHKGQPS